MQATLYWPNWHISSPVIPIWHPPTTTTTVVLVSHNTYDLDVTVKLIIGVLAKAHHVSPCPAYERVHSIGLVWWQRTNWIICNPCLAHMASGVCALNIICSSSNKISFLFGRTGTFCVLIPGQILFWLDEMGFLCWYISIKLIWSK